MRILIIGAGPTGLGAAHRLQELGHDDYRLCDRHPFFGGLATSYLDEKGYTWDFAVHVAHSHYHYVDELMDRLLPNGFYYHERRSWVREYGAWVPYPFQYNFRHLPDEAVRECVDGLRQLEADRKNGNVPPVENFEDWVVTTFGTGIARHFMLPYNRKIWSIDPAKMGRQWVGDRVPEVDLDRVVRNIDERKDDVSWGPNATFQFPKEGGTGAIWNKLGATLPEENVRLGTGVERIDLQARTATLSDGTVEHWDRIVSTMPLIRLVERCGIDGEVLDRVRQLKYTHVYCACIAPDFPIPDELAEKTWVYCPEEASPAYRVTPFSIFSPAHVPDPSKTCSFLCEVSVPGHLPMSDEDPTDGVIRGLRDIGLLDANPSTTHKKLLTAEFGYPVPTKDRDEILGDVQPVLEEEGIFSRGRFGGWKYEAANMDHSLMQGVEAVNRILHDEPEVTLPTPNVVNAGKR